jgi:hypothetical protein
MHASDLNKLAADTEAASAALAGGTALAWHLQ